MPAWGECVSRNPKPETLSAESRIPKPLAQPPGPGYVSVSLRALNAVNPNPGG